MKGIQGTSNKTYRQLLGNGIRHEIPKFQRDYSWKAQQWDDLWQDIQALYKDEENEYYMGYLVLQTHNNKEFQIIDGQQRLTTMSLFILAILKALNGLIKADIDPENADESWGEFSSEEIKRAVYRLGNLTLLEKKLNREAAQMPFSDKTNLFLQSSSELTKSIPEKFTSWNLDKLAARQRDLAKHAKAIWKIQELSF